MGAKPSKAQLHEPPKRNDFDPLDPPVAGHNLTMRQMGRLNENKLKYLHDLFDKQSMHVKNKKIRENNDDPTKMNRKE